MATAAKKVTVVRDVPSRAMAHLVGITDVMHGGKNFHAIRANPAYGLSDVLRA